MPAPRTPSQDNAVIIERLDGIRGDVGEVKAGMEGLLNWRREFEKENAVAHNQIDNRAQAAIKRSDDHEKRSDNFEERLTALEKALAPLVFTNRVLTFLASALVLSIMALIWAMLTGQVQVVYP